jgi:uncharacterized repeat protein (TIGR01451 family)
VKGKSKVKQKLKLALTPVSAGVLALLLVLVLARQAPAAPPQARALADQPDGSIIQPIQNTSGTWGPGTITATTDITITPGVVISVIPGTTIRISTTDGASAGLDPARIEFLVQSGAELRINGPVTFTSYALSPSPADWFGVRFLDESSGWVDRAVIEYGVHALTLGTGKPITVSNSQIRFNAHQPAIDELAFGAGLTILQGGHLIENTRIYSNTVRSTGTSDAYGGGITIQDGAPHILNSWIYENVVDSSAAGAGGGIAILSGAPLIEGSYVLSNTLTSDGVGVKSGGGIGIAGATRSVISRTWILGNESAPSQGFSCGGGIGFADDATGELIDRSVVAYNRATGVSVGGGICSSARNVFTVTNSLIYSNSSRSQSGGINLYGEINVFNNTVVSNTASTRGGIYRHLGDSRTFNNIVYGNTPNDISGNGGTAGSNLETDPGFLATGDLVHRFHLRHDSPALDAGVATADGWPMPDVDFDGQTRPLGVARDIGFDEVQPFTYRKTVDKDITYSNDSLVYTVVVENPDPFSAILSGKITDSVPLDTTYSSGPSCNVGSCSYDSGGNVIAWTGMVPASSSLGLTYTATVNAGVSNGTQITNTADVTLEGLSDTTQAVTTTIYNPAFAIAKSVAGAPVAGAAFSYAIVVANTSPHIGATNVLVTDALPAGATYISGADDFVDDIASWSVPAIVASDNASVGFTVSACQTVTNSRYRVVSSDQGIASDWGPEVITDLSDPAINTDFEFNPTVAKINSTVRLTDTTTTDGGQIAVWFWDFGDGDTSASGTTDHVFGSAGTFDVTLLVTDTCGFTGTTTSQVVVHAPALSVDKRLEPDSPVKGTPLTYTIAITNSDPVVDATGVVVTDALPAGASYISGGSNFDGTIVTWERLTVGAVSTAEASFVLSSCDSSSVNERYRVVTSTERVDSDWGSPVTTALADPTIDAGFVYSPSAVLIDETVRFTNTSTSDGGPITTWHWDYGDGEKGFGAAVSHAYATAGVYTVTLQVTDTCGFTAEELVSEAMAVSVPDIEVNPLAFAVALAPDSTTARTLTISNGGTVDLIWSLTPTPAVTWVSLPGGVASLPGSTAPTESDEVVVDIDSSRMGGGVYSTTLVVTSNDPTEPQINVDVTLTVTVDAEYNVGIEPSTAALSGTVSEPVTYTLVVRNLGNVDDSFAVDLNGNSWPTSTSAEAIGPLAPNTTETLEVFVKIPLATADGTTDVVRVSVASAGDPTTSASATLTTTVSWRAFLLPILHKQH